MYYTCAISTHLWQHSVHRTELHEVVFLELLKGLLVRAHQEIGAADVFRVRDDPLQQPLGFQAFN